MNGIPFLPGAWQVKHVEVGAPIAIAAHSGPWHLRQTIRGSVHYTTNMDEADIVFVYDHCYYMRWLGQVRSRPNTNTSAATLKGNTSIAAHSGPWHLRETIRGSMQCRTPHQRPAPQLWPT